MPLKIRLVREGRRKKNTHYGVVVKDDYTYFLCKGVSQFGKHEHVEGEESNCSYCNKILKGRNLTLDLYEHGEVEDTWQQQ